ncbi:uncharacterized protein STEHIDRAFT_106461 [Stereum hirsutum FP-91666 SS1]|uniref:uncharacterized protein n=1 Tax=Stereum hirsutum (strain FP-91666) TaxID=721885 RepID=UPI000440D612|nr:uncharacterized protein STEHIDRAFT_106461 [Stereum hirsutum FP-91666 SS1]EIM91740.1 hypothetical protein STEHIDRAFT_106461 [Stereum hirsutum FP-91666 SS1]
MAQSFYLVNLDKRQAYFIGEFGQMFFSDVTSYVQLISRLQRRLSPPSEPLLNGGNGVKGLQAAIDSKLARRLAERKRMKQWSLEDVDGKSLWDVELHEREDDDDYRLQWMPSIPSCGSGRETINALPNELIAMTFSFIADYDDALALGLTSSRFWAIGKSHLVRMLTRSQASAEFWPGDRIILVAFATNSLPQDLEVEYLGPAPNDPDDPDEVDRRPYNLMRALVQDIAFGKESVLFTQPWPIATKDFLYTGDFGTVGQSEGFRPWLKPFDRCVQTLKHGGAQRRTNDDGTFAAPEWILRNLTKKEYTREDAGPSGSLCHRLIVRSCWAEYIGSIDIYPEPESLCHGSWAGNRFDIVPLEDLELVLGKDGKVERVEGWTDVTSEDREEIDAICRAEDMSSHYGN